MDTCGDPDMRLVKGEGDGEDVEKFMEDHRKAWENTVEGIPLSDSSVLVVELFELVESNEKEANMPDYVMDLRKLVGSRPLILPGANMIILDSENRILLHLRNDYDVWDTPGGFSELGESVEETAIREVYEEVGLTCRNIKLFNVYSGKEQRFKYPNGDEVYNVTVTFVCRDFEGTINVDEKEGRDAQFFPFDNMPENIDPAIKMIIDDFIRADKETAGLY